MLRERRSVLIALLALASCKKEDARARRERRDRENEDERPAKRTASAVPSASTSAAGASQKVYPPLEFIKDEPAALHLAETERRPLLVDFAAEWCMACKELQKVTFADARVKEEGGRFVALRVDATDSDDAKVNVTLSKYKVTGLPAVLLFDSTGKEVKRFTSFVAAEEMLAALEAVK